MRLSLVVGLAVLLSSGPALAADKVQDPDQKIVCKGERVVGSNISTRVCKTKAEWDIAKKRTREFLDLKNGQLRAPKPKGSG